MKKIAFCYVILVTSGSQFKCGLQKAIILDASIIASLKVSLMDCNLSRKDLRETATTQNMG